MDTKTYINNTIELALKKYMLFKSKRDYTLAGDFLVYVISVLGYIYGETDITNPYLTNDTNVFEKNILKYGYSKNELNNFYQNLTAYLFTDKENKTNQYRDKNPYFMYVQENLIDMFIKKYVNQNLPTVELTNFEKILYTPNSNSEYRRNINAIMSPDINEVLNYYETKIFEVENVLSFEKVQKNLLDSSIYEAFGLNEKMVSNLKNKDINSINNQILNCLKISPIEPNLEEKIKDEITKIKPGKISYKLANNAGMVNILLFLLIFGAFVVAGIIIALKMIGR